MRAAPVFHFPHVNLAEKPKETERLRRGCGVGGFDVHGGLLGRV